MDYLVSAWEMQQLDQATIETYGVPGRVLMETAGRAVARRCAELLPSAARVTVACGKGNNGGDGYVAARALAAAGHQVSVFVFGELNAIRGDAGAALATLDKAGEATIRAVVDAPGLLAFSEALGGSGGSGGSALVIDALLGTGLKNDVQGTLADAIAVINDYRRGPVVSVDIASGVDSDTGVILGHAVRAQHTVTFGYPKRGHYLTPGASMRGELQVVDIGIPRALADAAGIVARVMHPHDGPKALARRELDCHKGHFGHLVVVAGAPPTPGAAHLALLGAMRSGAGLISWATDDDTRTRVLAPPEIMLRLRSDESADAWAARAVEDATALVVGPGWTTARPRVAELRALLAAAEVPICIDADGLNLMAEHKQLWQRVHAPLVLTPHPREMARLMGWDVAQVQRDRIAAALELAVSRACVCVLKGAGTVVADPDGTATVVAAGSPALATGGTGDVLAGVIGGLLAAGHEPSTAARLGVLLHAEAGTRVAARLGEAGTCASDVAHGIGEVLAAWQR